VPGKKIIKSKNNNNKKTPIIPDHDNPYQTLKTTKTIKNAYREYVYACFTFSASGTAVTAITRLRQNAGHHV
jgi:hypothetical protein